MSERVIWTMWLCKQGSACACMCVCVFVHACMHACMWLEDSVALVGILDSPICRLLLCFRGDIVTYCCTETQYQSLWLDKVGTHTHTCMSTSSIPSSRTRWAHTHTHTCMSTSSIPSSRTRWAHTHKCMSTSSIPSSRTRWAHTHTCMSTSSIPSSRTKWAHTHMHDTATITVQQNSQSHGDVLCGLAIQHINGIQTCVHTVPIHKSLTSLCTRL